jgi:hypothetical protein
MKGVSEWWDGVVVVCVSCFGVLFEGKGDLWLFWRKGL